MAVRMRDCGVQPEGDSRLDFLPQARYALFQEFIVGEPKEKVISVFRKISEMLRDRTLDDYHLKLQDGYRGAKWKVVVFYGGQPREGPKARSQCMSCNLDCPLKSALLGHGEDAVDGICVRPELRYWLDAQGRDKLIVTPTSHLERLSDLDDSLLFDFWQGAVELMSALHFETFRSMVLNHGTCQNHSHLHLKINLDDKFSRVSRQWPQNLQDKLASVKAFAKELKDAA